MIRLFLCSLCAALLIASPVAAEPITTAIGLFVGASAAGAAAVGAFILRVVATIALTAIQRARMKKRQRKGAGLKRESTTTGDTTPQSIVIGRYATGGNAVCPAMSHGTYNGLDLGYLTYVIDLCDRPITSLLKIFVNGEEAVFDTQQAPVDAGYQASGKFAGKLWLKFHDGSQTEADPYLLSRYSTYPERPWQPDMVGKGVPYAIVTMARDSAVYSGFPQLRFELLGIPLYDPRKDSTVGGVGGHRWSDPSTWDYSDNAMVAAYNVLKGFDFDDGSWWGGRASFEQLPLAVWVAAMNACDPEAEGGGAPIDGGFRVGYELTLDEEPIDVLEKFMQAAGAEYVCVGGVWLVRVGPVAMPTYFFTDDDILRTQERELDPYPALKETFNAIHASYPEPAEGWEVKEAPAVYDEEFEAADAGSRLITDLDFEAVPYVRQVTYLMRAWLQDGRRFLKHSLTLPPDALRVNPLEAVSWTSQRHGYTAKIFEVDMVVTNGALLSKTLVIRERDAGDYVPVLDDDILDVPAPIGVIEPSVPPIPGFDLVAFEIKDQGGIPRRPALKLVWDAEALGDPSGLEWIVQDAQELTVASGVQQVLGDGEFLIASGILPNVTYRATARVQSNLDGGWMDWVFATTPNIQITPDVLDDAVWDAVGDEAASVAAALDDDLVINEIQPLKREVDLRATEQRTVSEAVAMIGDQVLWVTSRLSDVDGKLADAGIVTDPETGKVRIYALEQEAERISEAEIRLSAAEASIALSATQAWVRGEITAALLDPSQLPLVEDLQLQVNAVEVELDAINADLALRASQTEVDGIGARLSTAEADLDAAQTAINLKAEQTQLDVLQGRVQTAEVAISAFDGPQLTQTVADTRYLLAADEEAAEQTLASLLQAHADGERIRQDIAYATEDLRAKVTEDREAFAIRSVQIGASIDNAMALIEQESLARASQGEALAASLNTLTTTVDENTATVQTLSESVDGISGRHMLRVNVNGVATGMVIAAEAGDDGAVSSSVAFAADSFTISAPDGSSLTVPFSVFTVGRTIDGIYYPPGVYMEDIYVRRAIIGRADIHTANIAEGAITNNFAAFAGSDFYLSSSYQEVLAIDNVECSGNTMSLQANIQVDGASAIEIEVRVNGAPQRVFTVSAGIFMQQQSYPVGFTARGSTYVGEGGGWVNISVNGTASAHIVPTPIFYADLKTIMMTVTPGEGTHRVSLHARLKAGSMSASAHVFNRFLQVEETKR